MPTAFLHDSSIDIEKDAVRQEINGILSHSTAMPCVTPYAALRRVSKALAYFHIYLPKKSYMEGDRGVEVYEIKQFGERMGFTDQGEWISHVPAKFHLVFRYRLMGASFYVSAKIVDKEGLDKELDQAEAMVSEARKVRSRKVSPPWSGPDRIATDNHMARVRKLAQNAMMRMSRKKPVKEGFLDSIRGAVDNAKGAIAKSTGMDKLGNALGGAAQAAPKPDMRIMGNPDTQKKTPKDGSANSAFPANEEVQRPSMLGSYIKKATANVDNKLKINNPKSNIKPSMNEGEDEDYMKKYAGSENPAAGVKSVPRKKRLTARAKIIKALGPGKVKSTAGGISHTKRGKEMGDFDTTNYFDRKGNKVGRNTATIEVEREEYEHQLHEISHKLALRAMKKSEKRADDEWEADYAHDRLSDWKTHDTRAHRLRGHMKRKFGNKKIKTDGEDRLGDGGGEGRTGVLGVNKQGKRAGLPPKEQVNRLKSNIKFSLGKHHKPNLPEETQIDEISQQLTGRYRSLASTDLAHRTSKALRDYQADKPVDKKNRKKSLNRVAGIRRADKRFKEETQIDELYGKGKLKGIIAARQEKEDQAKREYNAAERKMMDARSETGKAEKVKEKLRLRNISKPGDPHYNWAHSKKKLREEEQIDELSYDTVARYHRKAAERFHTGEEPEGKRKKGREMATRKRAGGMMGIPKAKVMAKEETRLDEVGDTSKGREVLKSYIKKAGGTHRESGVTYQGLAHDAKPGGELSKNAARKSGNRARGVERAVDRLDEISAKLVGRVSNARYNQGKAPSKTLSRAINKKFIETIGDPVTGSQKQAPKEKLKSLKRSPKQ